MFDSYHRHTYGGPSRIDVHEERAPTDASVKLLREMEQAARDSVLNTFSVDNVFKAKLVELRINPLTDDAELWCVFTLNGEQFKLKCAADVHRELRFGDPCEAGKKLRAELARVLADELMSRADVVRP